MQNKFPYNPAAYNYKANLPNNKNKVYIFLLFILSPFLTLLVAIRNYRSGWAKNVVWLFVAFYGYTVVISGEGIDAASYRNYLIQMVQADLNWNSFSSRLYSENDGYADVLQPIITFIVSRFTADHRILFLVFALLFGYFYSRNIWLLLDWAGPSLKKEALQIIIIFVLIIPFWQINGFRMWTAAHVFFYGGILYLLKINKSKGLIIASISILVHFSFILPVMVLILFAIAKNRVHIYYWTFVTTFFISEIDLGAVRDILISVVPGFLINRVEDYTNFEYAENISAAVQTLNWYVVFYGKALKWALIVFISCIYFNGLDFIKSNKPLLTLYCFSLLFLAIGNITSLVPSGGRFVNVANLFAVSAVFLYLQHGPKDRLLNKLMLITIPALLLFCIVSLRIGFETINVMAILGNPVLAVFMDVNIELLEFLK